MIGAADKIKKGKKRACCSLCDLGTDIREHIYLFWFGGSRKIENVLFVFVKGELSRRFGMDGNGFCLYEGAHASVK